MLWFKKKTTHQLYFVVFGLVALGIVLSTAVLLFAVIKKAGSFSSSTKILAQSLDFPQTSSPALVRDNYFQGLKTLVEKLKTSSSVEALIADFENSFLSLRVPAEMRETHLSAWLEWLRFKSSNPKIETEDLRQILLALVANIIQQN